ncbi:MAG: hypothetical protein WCV83_02480 [Candidatus Magasanikbacteria bacterium]|jgi:hypothetical protein
MRVLPSILNQSRRRSDNSADCGQVASSEADFIHRQLLEHGFCSDMKEGAVGTANMVGIVCSTAAGRGAVVLLV